MNNIFHGVCFPAVCSHGKYGIDCRDTCVCENGGHCDIAVGQCACPAGWVGPVCEQKCSAGRYGLNCMQSCDCQNGSPCDHVTGACECVPGYMGEQCKEGGLWWSSRNWNRWSLVFKLKISWFLQCLFGCKNMQILMINWNYHRNKLFAIYVIRAYFYTIIVLKSV